MKAEKEIFVGIKLEEGLPDRETIFDDLKEKGYPLVDFTDNEVAKIHLRYMVGGHAGNISPAIFSH